MNQTYRFRRVISPVVATIAMLLSGIASAQTTYVIDSDHLYSTSKQVQVFNRVQTASSDAPAPDVAAVLGVTAHSIQPLVFEDAGQNTLEFHIRLAQSDVTIRLAPYSLRGTNFLVNLYDQNGNATPTNIDAARTYRGVINGEPGSAVAASIIDGQLTGMIFTADGRQWSIQPLTDVSATANRGDHVVFDVADLIDDGSTCGVESATRPSAGSGAPRGLMTSCNPIVETLAIVSDFDYYQNNSSNPTQTVDAIEAIINPVSMIYEQQLGIRYELGQIEIWNTGNPILPVSIGGGEIDEQQWLADFRTWYNANLPGISRRFAHMFSGLDFSGGTIGRAYLDVPCNLSFAYGVNQIRTNRFARNVSLVAHEAGHNWGAEHCDGFTNCDIMLSGNSLLGTTFGPNATNEIVGAGAPLFACITPAVAASDCNLNGICDDIEIGMGLAQDNNFTGVPDDCERVHNTSLGLYYFNINDALLEAFSGNTLVVAPGTYHESVNYLGKTITLQSSAGPDATIIDVTGFGTRGVLLSGGSITGFTIQGASGGSFSNAGGGIEVLTGSATINDCIIRDNIMPAGFFGGGVFINGASVTISNTLFCNNAPQNVQGSFSNGGGNTFPATCPAIATCGSALGDVNEDGNIDGSDVQSFVDCYLTGNTSNGDCLCADVVTSGNLNAADIAALVGLLVGP